MGDGATEQSVSPTAPASPSAPRRRWFRFSLRTLVIFVLLVGSAMMLHHNWEPWYTVCVLAGHNGLFSPDGSRILTLGDDSDARIWDIRGGFITRVKYKGTSGIIFPAFSPDGRWIRTLCSDDDPDGAHLFNSTTGGDLFAPGEIAQRISFTPDGRRFCVFYRTKDAEVRDSETRAVVTTLKNTIWKRYSGSWGPVLSPDGRVVLAEIGVPTELGPNSYCSHFRIWDAETGTLIADQIMDIDIAGAVFAPDGSLCFARDHYQHESVVILDAHTGKTVRRFEGAMPGNSLFPDRPWVLLNTEDGISVTDFAKGTVVYRGQGAAPHIWGNTPFSPDGKKLLTIWPPETSLWSSPQPAERTFRIYDAVSGTECARTVVPGERSGWCRVEWLRDLVLIEFQGAKGCCSSLVWPYGACGKVIELPAVRASSPNKERIATYEFGESTALIWDPLIPRRLASLRGHAGIITSLAWSPNGQLILTASADKTARLWARRHSDARFGFLTMPEFWLTAAFAVAFVWSVWRDRKTL